MGTKQQIDRAGFLLARGFELISPKTDDSAFGDSSIVLEGHGLRIRISRDRGQEFVEVASKHHPDEWFDLSLLLQAFGPREMCLELTDLEIEAPLLEGVLPKLEKALAEENWEATYRKLKELEIARMKERFPGLRIHPSR